MRPDAFVRRAVTSLQPGLKCVLKIVGSPWAHVPIVALILGLVAISQGGLAYDTYVVQLGLIYLIAVLGLNIPTGFAGALSVGQGASFVSGGYAVGVLIREFSAPFWLTLPVALLTGLLIGGLMGAPSARLGALALAIVSLGYTLIVSDLILNGGSFTGGANGLAGITATWWFGTETTLSPLVLFFVTLTVACAVYAFHWRLRDSKFGRAAFAAGADEQGAQALHVNTYLVKVVAFSIGSGLGALAGALFAYANQYISTDRSTVVNWSIAFLLMVILGGRGTRIGPVVGTAVIAWLPIYLSRYPRVDVLLYGTLLIAVVRLFPRGVIGRTAIMPRRYRTTEPPPVGESSASTSEPAGSKPAIQPGPPQHEELAVSMDAGRKSFGGVVALDGISLDVGWGEVVAIVGPNGSGKTSLLNVLSGFAHLDSGQLTVCGQAGESRSARAIAGMGVSRTFQTPKIFPALSPREHLMIAREWGQGTALPSGLHRILSQLLSKLEPQEGRPGRPEAAAAYSHGSLRFLELALAVTRQPRLLLLDEPAAGLSVEEIGFIGEVITALKRSGISTIVVEHHLEFVQDIADRVIVCHMGRVLWQGKPEELAEDEQVRVTYLGHEAHQDAAETAIYSSKRPG